MDIIVIQGNLKERRGKLMSKRVLVTGGNKGLGVSITKYFLERDYEVIVVGRNFDNFEYKDYEKVSLVKFNLNRIEEIDELVEQVGEIDVLINNAGVRSKNFVLSEYSNDKVDEMVNVNIKAPVELMKKYGEIFSKKGSGRVINVASQASEIGHLDIWYGITKAGLVNATKAFAAIYGKNGVIFNSVSPGPIKTREKEEGETLVRFQKLVDRTYIGRVLHPEEVANVIGYLAIEAPEYLNGENIDLNNGAQKLAI